MAGPKMDDGDAIFSTHLGRFRSRGVELPARIVLRSSPEDDMEAKIADLQAKFPAQCKAIDSPIANLYKYFDAYDQQLHGERFLHAVLTQIFERNVIRGHAIQEYASVWHNLNPTALPWIDDYGMNSFTEDDVAEYGKDFLEEVLQCLQRQKRLQEDMQAKARAHESAMQAQEHARQVSTTPHPVYLPQEQQGFTHDQRNRPVPPTSLQTFSRPPSSHAASSETYEPAPPAELQTFGQSNWSPSILDPTPEIPEANLHPPMAQRQQRLEKLVKQPLESAALSFPGQVANCSDPMDNSINAPRTGYSDAFLADLPPLPTPYRQMPAVHHVAYQPANTMGNPSRSRPPIHTGLSNDARVLEVQGIRNGRRSFGEANIGRINQHAYDQPMPQPGSSTHFQKNYAYGASLPFARQAHGPSNAVPIDFDHPQRATEARKAFYDGVIRLGQEFGYDVRMSPARVYSYKSTAYEGTAGSPQTNVARQSGHQGSNGPDTKQLESAAFQIDATERTTVRSIQDVPASNKREQINADGTPTGTSLPHSASELGASDQQELCALETTHDSEVPSSVPQPEISEVAHDHQDIATHSTAPGATPPSMAEVDGHAAPSQKKKTPSPKKRKAQNARKDDLGAGKAGQAKQRKDMLSNLRTEKAVCDPNPRPSATDNAQQARSAGEADPATDPKDLALHTTDLGHPMIAGARSQEVEETAAVLQRAESTRDTSPAGQGDSSIPSAMESTRATSSEPVLTSEVDIQAAIVDASTIGSKEGAPKGGQPNSDIALMIKADVTLSLRDTMLESSDKTDAAIPTSSEVEQVQPPREADWDISWAAIPTGHATEVFNKDVAQQATPPSETASSSKHRATSSALQSSSASLADAQPQKASSSSMRGPPRDLRDLVAIPRNLPPVRHQPQLLKTYVDGAKLCKGDLEAVGSSEMPTNPEAMTRLAPNTLRDLSPLRSKSSSVLDEQQSPGLPAAREASECSVDRIDGVEKARDIEAQAEDNTEVCELMSASDSVATAVDDPFDPDTSTPQKFAAALQKQRADAPPQHPPEQPAVEQKKGKKKKGKKKSKKSKSSQAEPTDDTNVYEAEPTAAQGEGKPAMVPIVERPFVSDEGHDLSPPTFVKRNHSSMRERIDDGQGKQRLLPSFTVSGDGSAKSAHSLNSTKQESRQASIGKRLLGQLHDPTLGQAADGRQDPQALSSSGRVISDNVDSEATQVNIQSIQTTHNASGLLHRLDEKKGLAKIQEYCQEHNKVPSHKLFFMLNTLSPQRMASNGAIAPVGSFDGSSRKRDIAAVLEDSEPVHPIDDATRQAHRRDMDNLCLEDGDSAHSRVTDMLNAVVPESSDDESAHSRVTDMLNTVVPEPSQDESAHSRLTDMLNAVVPGSSEDESARSRVTEMLNAIVPETSEDEMSDKKLGDDDDYQAHANKVDEGWQTNNEFWFSQNSYRHSEKMPEPSSFERQAHDTPPLDEHCLSNGEDSLHATSEMPQTIASSDGEDLDKPRIEEIFDDEALPPDAPKAPLKERAQRMLPSRDASPDTLASEEPAEATAAAGDICQSEQRESMPRLSDRLSASRIAASRTTASLPSTRRTSQERERPRSLSPLEGLGLSKLGGPSANLENLSPTRLQPQQSLSYKEVAATSSMTPIQAGGFGGLVSRDNGQGKKDPWRVPSAEANWGASNKSRGKSFTEASEAQK
ncbi:MAG: hypothetical protein Q9207_000739 [Kuettlingeria erythrocarpa]